MPLQDQIIDLPIVGGIAEKEDAVLSVRPRSIVNLVYRKTGALHRRYGYTGIGLFNARLAQSGPDATPPTPARLATFKDELVRIGDGAVDSFTGLATSDWVYRGQASEVFAEKESLTGGAAAVEAGRADVAYANGYVLAAYTRDGSVYADVTRDGTRLYSAYAVAADRVLIGCFSLGTTLFVTYFHAVGNVYRTLAFDTTAAIWGADVVLASGAIVDIAAVTAFDSSSVVLAWPVVAVSDDIRVQRLTWTGSSWSSTHSVDVGGTPETKTAIAVAVGSANVWLTYAVGTPDTRKVVVIPMSLTLTPSAGASNTFGIVEDIQTLWALPSSATTVYVGASTTERALLEEYTNGSTLEILRQFRETRWSSRAFNVGDRAYAAANDIHALGCSHYLIEVSDVMGKRGRVASFELPLQLSKTNATSDDTQWLSSVAFVDANTVLVVAVVDGSSVTPGDVAADVYAVSIAAETGIRYTWGAEQSFTQAELSNVLVLGGGVVSAYDGAAVAELQFFAAPDISVLPAFGPWSGPGDLTLLGTYSYKFVFVRRDAQGNVYRSAPSLAATVVLTGTDSAVEGGLPYCRLTNADDVGVEVYRTVDLGTTYYYVATFANDMTGENTLFADTLSDAAIQSRAQLYTTGGVLQNDCPPSARLVSAYKNALVLAGTDDDSLWVSRAVVAGEPPAFNLSVTIAPFSGGRCTALMPLDATIVVAKERALFYMQGDPPADDGTSNLSDPQPIQSEVGCTDPASVAPTSLGCFFLSKTGLVLLDRSLMVNEAGQQVTDTLAEVTQLAGVQVLPEQELIRFLPLGASTAVVVDVYHTAKGQDWVWTTDVYQDPAGVDAPDIRATTVWRGNAVWISSDGRLYQETVDTFLDVAQAVESWIPISFTTGAEKANGPSSFQRVKRVACHAKQQSASGAQITITTDTGSSQVSTWTDAQVAAFTGLPAVKLRSHLAGNLQKCQYVYVKFEDVEPDVLGTGEGMVLEAMSLELGVAGGFGRVGSAKKR